MVPDAFARMDGGSESASESEASMDHACTRKEEFVSAKARARKLRKVDEDSDGSWSEGGDREDGGKDRRVRTKFNWRDLAAKKGAVAKE